MSYKFKVMHSFKRRRRENFLLFAICSFIILYATWLENWTAQVPLISQSQLSILANLEKKVKDVEFTQIEHFSGQREVVQVANQGLSQGTFSEVVPWEFIDHTSFKYVSFS